MTEPTDTVSNKRTEGAAIPAGMEWDAAEYADKDGLESDENGTVYFADSRSDAWHQLGQQVGHTMNAEEALRESHLGGWDVRKTPIQTITEDGVFEIPGKFAMVRTNPTTKKAEPLGSAVVGNFYTPVQNEANVDVLQAIIDETGATIETLGALNRGQNVFVTMKLPKGMLIGGVDAVDLYIAGLNSHDGTSRFNIITTPVRIVCQNTERAAIKGLQSQFQITHTKSATQRVAQAREALKLTFAYAEAFEAEAEAMIKAQMTKDQFVKVTRSIWAKPVTKGENEAAQRKITIHAKREDLLVDLFSNADTQENIRGTAWAGYNAITEYLDHFQNVQTREHGNQANARAARTIMGRSDDEKLLAFSKSLAFANR